MRLETLFRFFGFLAGSLTLRRESFLSVVEFLGGSPTSRRSLLVSGIVLGILSDTYEVACSGRLPKS
jgi:hypothetical protein